MVANGRTTEQARDDEHDGLPRAAVIVGPIHTGPTPLAAIWCPWLR
jgi:hypothetical protein